MSLRRKYASVLIVGGGPVGSFTSLLLKRFGISNLIAESQASHASHPKAHVLHSRSMEMLRFLGLEKTVYEKVPPSEHWRRFRYCVSMLGKTLAIDDHYRSPEYRALTQASPCRVTQLSQPLLESIMKSSTGEDLFMYRHKLKSFTTLPSGKIESILQCEDEEVIIESDFLVGADGTQSSIRNILGIGQTGQRDMETFASVHFTSLELSRKLGHQNGAMLSFVFNPKVMGVVVSHDMRRGEWVFHGPVFPPAQDATDYTHPDKCKRIVEDAIGSHLPDLSMHSVQIWGMHALLADSFSSPDNRVFLAGDAAHQFPPSGGFGVNAGLGDAYNLAWKLCYVLKGRASMKLLNSYSEERRAAVGEALSIAVDNYRRGLLPAQVMGLERASIAAAMPLLNKQSADKLLSLGRMHLTIPEIVADRIKKLIENDHAGLPLIFPKVDKGYVYSESSVIHYDDKAPRQSKGKFWIAPYYNRSEQRFVEKGTEPGKLIPHCWVTDSDSEKRISTLDVVALGSPKHILIVQNRNIEFTHPDIKKVVFLSRESEKTQEQGVYYFNSDWKSMLNENSMILVRPDGHISWRGTDVKRLLEFFNKSMGN